MGSVTLDLRLDEANEADRVGFEAIRATLRAVDGLPPESWRVVGGWMVRAWVEATSGDDVARQTVDADLALLPVGAGGKAHRVPEILLGSGFHPHEELFRLVDDRGRRIDLLVPPGASRHDPSRIGPQIAYEAPGSRFAFELPPLTVRVRMRRQSLLILVPALAAALVSKAVTLGVRRPLRARDDAVDVGLLLSVVDREPHPAVEDLREHRRRGDVRRALRTIDRDFASEGSPGAVWVEQEMGKRRALLSVASAQALLAELR